MRLKSHKLNQKGFTLIELLVVVSLIIIVVGVTGDIVITLVRSYSKTQITNEIEQNSNFVITKLEKELRNALAVTEVQSDALTFTRRSSAGITESITYSIEDASSLPDSAPGTFYIGRAVDGGLVNAMTNYTSPSGVTVIPGGTSFVDQSPVSGPTVIQINLEMRQIGNPSVQFTQSQAVQSTVVVRGSY